MMRGAMATREWLSRFGDTLLGNLTMTAANVIKWASSTVLEAPADMQLRIRNAADTLGAVLTAVNANGFEVRTKTGTAPGNFDCRSSAYGPNTNLANGSNSTAAAGENYSGFTMRDTFAVTWRSGASLATSNDTGIARSAAGIVKATNGSSGNGSFIADSYRLNGAASQGIYTGTGSPESVVTAPIGSLYLRLDGGASTTLYVKTSGTGNTGWTAK